MYNILPHFKIGTENVSLAIILSGFSGEEISKCMKSKPVDPLSNCQDLVRIAVRTLRYELLSISRILIFERTSDTLVN